MDHNPPLGYGYRDVGESMDGLQYPDPSYVSPYPSSQLPLVPEDVEPHSGPYYLSDPHRYHREPLVSIEDDEEFDIPSHTLRSDPQENRQFSYQSHVQNFLQGNLLQGEANDSDDDLEGVEEKKTNAEEDEYAEEEEDDEEGEEDDEKEENDEGYRVEDDGDDSE